MQVAQSEAYLCPIEPGTLLREDALLVEMEEQLPTVDVLHDKAEAVVGLEGILEVLKRAHKGPGEYESTAQPHHNGPQYYGVHFLF